MFFLLLVNRCGCKDNKKNVNTTLFREKFLKKCVFNTKKEPAKIILEAPQQNKEAPQQKKEAPETQGKRTWAENSADADRGLFRVSERLHPYEVAATGQE